VKWRLLALTQQAVSCCSRLSVLLLALFQRPPYTAMQCRCDATWPKRQTTSERGGMRHTPVESTTVQYAGERQTDWLADRAVYSIVVVGHDSSSQTCVNLNRGRQTNVVYVSACANKTFFGRFDCCSYARCLVYSVCGCSAVRLQLALCRLAKSLVSCRRPSIDYCAVFVRCGDR